MIFRKDTQMKQQCHITFIYGSWLIFAFVLIFYVTRGQYVQAGVWICFIPFFLWLYVRYFPTISRYMGYGSVDDRPSNELHHTSAKVILYTGLGCPFCPLVKSRLKDLQSEMGFDFTETDITLKPDVLISKGIRALPVVEVGQSRWVGNATSEQLATFISSNAVPKMEV
jgi:glutaredoxin